MTKPTTLINGVPHTHTGRTLEIAGETYYVVRNIERGHPKFGAESLTPCRPGFWRLGGDDVPMTSDLER